LEKTSFVLAGLVLTSRPAREAARPSQPRARPRDAVGPARDPGLLPPPARAHATLAAAAERVRRVSAMRCRRSPRVVLALISRQRERTQNDCPSLLAPSLPLPHSPATPPLPTARSDGSPPRAPVSPPRSGIVRPPPSNSPCTELRPVLPSSERASPLPRYPW
jgi:hypothetical protein